MTYCIGVMLDEGLVFASDSRTHAGVDNFAKFCKMTVFERRGDRVIVLLSSGNLAGTQAVIGVLNQRCAAGDASPNLWSAQTMFDVAMLVADAMRDIERRDGQYLEQNDDHLQCLVHPRRADPRRADTAVPDLCRGQLHRSRDRHAFLSDRRNQVRQADHRPRDYPLDAPCGGGEVCSGVV